MHTTQVKIQYLQYDIYDTVVNAYNSGKDIIVTIRYIYDTVINAYNSGKDTIATIRYIRYGDLCIQLR